MTAREIIITLFVKHNCDWDETYNAIKNKEPVTEEDVLNCKEASDPQYISIVDEDYPEEFKNFYKPPFVVQCIEKVV